MINVIELSDSAGVLLSALTGGAGVHLINVIKARYAMSRDNVYLLRYVIAFLMGFLSLAADGVLFDSSVPFPVHVMSSLVVMEGHYQFLKGKEDKNSQDG